MIPEIQRNYMDWKRSGQKIAEDIIKFFMLITVMPNYFLGTCIMYEGSEYGGAMQIMDGQQRVTSIMAFYCAIKLHLEKKQELCQRTKRWNWRLHWTYFREYFFRRRDSRSVVKPKVARSDKIIGPNGKINGDSLEEKFDKNSPMGWGS